MSNVLSKEKQLSILNLLVEGNSIRSTERLTGIHRDTIMRVLVRFGQGCQLFLDHSFVNLNLRHIQVDEIWTFVQKKQGRLTATEKDDETIGDQYLFLALDTDTKLIATYMVGKRTSSNAFSLMADLQQRLAPIVNQNLPQISTDGFPGYPNAVNLAFGDTARHGVLIKQYAEPQTGRYAPPMLAGTERINVNAIDDVRTICTSHVERCNLTIRTFMKRFTRLALGFSKKLANLSAAIACHIAHYNFCRIHNTLRCTPAMAAKVTHNLWSFDRLFDEVTALVAKRRRAGRIEQMLARMRSVLN